MPLKRGPIYDDITYTTSMTVAVPYFQMLRHELEINQIAKQG